MTTTAVLSPADLLQAALQDTSKERRFAAVDALAASPQPDVPALVHVVRESHDDDLRVRALEMLARAGTPEADEELLRVVSRDNNPRRVRSAARYLARYRLAENVSALVGLLAGPKPTEVKSAVVTELVDRVDPQPLQGYRQELAGALVAATDPALALMLARVLARLGTGDERLEVVLDALLQSTTVSRESLDGKVMGTALQPQDAKDRRRMVHRLIRAGRHSDDRHAVGLVASLLIVITGGADAAGHALNEAGARDPDLQPLRLQIGGEAALTPLLKSIEEDLEKYFREPLHKLREDTEENWRRSMRSAERAFTVRVVMSVLVFAVGLGLVIASSVALFTGADGDTLFGQGVSLVTGIGAMLLVVYTGPLKDIKASAADLGSANAAFIAYVHRVSEISHTFSAQYLKEELSYEDLERSCRLLRQAAADAIKELHMPDGASAKAEHSPGS